MDRRFEIFVGNDIFSIGNYPDDYRTRQFVLALQINDRWSVVVDHSILTFEPPAESDAGCLDQLSGSIGAGWRSERSHRSTILTVRRRVVDNATQRWMRRAPC